MRGLEEIREMRLRGNRKWGYSLYLYYLKEHVENPEYAISEILNKINKELSDCEVSYRAMNTLIFYYRNKIEKGKIKDKIQLVEEMETQVFQGHIQTELNEIKVQEEYEQAEADKGSGIEKKKEDVEVELSEDKLAQIQQLEKEEEGLDLLANMRRNMKGKEEGKLIIRTSIK